MNRDNREQPSAPLTQEERLKLLLVRVGDEGIERMQAHIAKLLSSISKSDLAHREYISKTLLDCISCLPHKATIYGCAIALISIDNSKWAEEIINKSFDLLQRGINENNMLQIKNTLRVFAELVKCKILKPSALLQIFSAFVTEGGETSDCSVDFYVWPVVSVLYSVGQILRAECASDFGILEEQINQLLLRREKSNVKHAINPFCGKADTKDYIDLFWEQFKKDGMKSEAIYRPYTEFEKEFEDHKFQVESFHTKITFKDRINPVSYYVPVKLNILESQTAKDIPVLNDRLVLADVLSDFIIAFKESTKIGARQLGLLQLGHKLGNLIIEVLFESLFKLPVLDAKLIFFNTLAVSLSKQHSLKKDEFLFTTALQDAVVSLLKNIDIMDTECIDRLILFVAVYLINSNFDWDWKKWQDYFEAIPDSSLGNYFVRWVFIKICNQTYPKKVTEAVPAFFHKYIPKEAKATLKYDKELQGDEHADVSLIIDRMKEKYDVAQMQELLYNSNHIHSTGNTVTELFVQALLYTGSPTLEHLKKLIERYMTIISPALSTREAQIMAIKCIYDTWPDKPQMKVLLVDKLMRFTLVESASIIDWVFRQVKIGDYEDYNKVEWEILSNVLSKVVIRKELIDSELIKVQMLPVDKQDDEKKDKLVLAIKKVTEDEKGIFSLIYKKFDELIDGFERGVEESDKDAEKPEEIDFHVRKKIHLKLLKQRFLQFGRSFVKETKSYIQDIEVSKSASASELFNLIKLAK